MFFCLWAIWETTPQEAKGIFQRDFEIENDQLSSEEILFLDTGVQKRLHDQFPLERHPTLFEKAIILARHLKTKHKIKNAQHDILYGALHFCQDAEKAERCLEIMIDYISTSDTPFDNLKALRPILYWCAKNIDTLDTGFYRAASATINAKEILENKNLLSADLNVEFPLVTTF